MAVPDDLRCKFIKENGEQCRIAVLKKDGVYCLFHSPLQEAKDLIRGGQRKGSKTPKKVLINYPGLRRRCFCLSDLKQFSNSLKESYIHGRINSRQLEDLTRWAAAHKKCIEALDIESEVDKLRLQIQELREGPDETSGPITLKVQYDADGNAIKMRKTKEAEE